MKLIFENISNFVRNQDPLKSLGLGYETKIRNFFRQYNVSDKDYEVKEGNIFFNTHLTLRGSNITELPDNLTVDGFVSIRRTKISKLPNNLVINDDFYLSETNIAELPNDLIVKGGLDIKNTLIKKIPKNLFNCSYITCNTNQVDFIKSDGFKGRLFI